MLLRKAILVSALLIPEASAQNCLYSDRSGYTADAGSAHFFDLEVKVPAVAVRSLNVRLRTYPSTARLNVYRIPTTWVGREGSKAGWTQLVTNAPIPSPAPGQRSAKVVLPTPFVIAKGTYGFAFEYLGAQPDFDDGVTPPYQIAKSNNELTLYEGAVDYQPFTGGGRRQAPRVIHGGFCYDVSPGTALAIPYGMGCPSGYTLSLDSERPVIGTTVEVTASRVSFRSAANALIVSGTSLPGSQPLPGMGSCFLYAVPTVTIPVRRTSSTVRRSFAIPQTTPGARIYCQFISLRPDVNAIGIATSNGLEWRVYAQ